MVFYLNLRNYRYVSNDNIFYFFIIGTVSFVEGDASKHSVDLLINNSDSDISDDESQSSSQRHNDIESISTSTPVRQLGIHLGALDYLC